MVKTDRFFRYFFILHGRLYNKIFTVKGTILALILLWVCVFSLDIANMPFVGLGYHGFNAYGLHCSFTVTKNFFYNTIVYSGLAVAFPALVVLFCYGRILYTTQSKYTCRGKSFHTFDKTSFFAHILDFRRTCFPSFSWPKILRSNKGCSISPCL